MSAIGAASTPALHFESACQCQVRRLCILVIPSYLSARETHGHQTQIAGILEELWLYRRSVHLGVSRTVFSYRYASNNVNTQVLYV